MPPYNLTFPAVGYNKNKNKLLNVDTNAFNNDTYWFDKYNIPVYNSSLIDPTNDYFNVSPLLNTSNNNAGASRELGLLDAANLVNHVGTNFINDKSPSSVLRGAGYTAADIALPGLGTAMRASDSIINGASKVISNGYHNNTIDDISKVYDYIPGGKVMQIPLAVGNRLFGSKLNKSYIDSYNNELNNYNKWSSTADNYDVLSADLSRMPELSALSGAKVGSDGPGLFGMFKPNKAKKEYDLLSRKTDEANRLRSDKINTAIGNVAANQNRNMSMNYRSNFACGGRLFDDGGNLHVNGLDFSNPLMYINEGGTHEINPNQGVPVSINQQDGQPNLVEEGETIANGDYVFSNRIQIPDEVAKKLRVPKGKTFAQASKLIAKESEELPSDPIIKRALEENLMYLQTAQEQVKQSQAEQEKALQAILTGQYADGGTIHIKEQNKGLFTKAAKRAGMGTQEYARHILANKDDYSSTLVKRANFARNAAGWQHGKGGHIFQDGGEGGKKIPDAYIKTENVPQDVINYWGIGKNPDGYFDEQFLLNNGFVKGYGNDPYYYYKPTTNAMPHNPNSEWTPNNNFGMDVFSPINFAYNAADTGVEILGNTTTNAIDKVGAIASGLRTGNTDMLNYGLDWTNLTSTPDPRTIIGKGADFVTPKSIDDAVLYVATDPLLGKLTPYAAKGAKKLFNNIVKNTKKIGNNISPYVRGLFGDGAEVAVQTADGSIVRVPVENIGGGTIKNKSTMEFSNPFKRKKGNTSSTTSSTASSTSNNASKEPLKYFDDNLPGKGKFVADNGNLNTHQQNVNKKIDEIVKKADDSMTSESDNGFVKYRVDWEPFWDLKEAKEAALQRAYEGYVKETIKDPGNILKRGWDRTTNVGKTFGNFFADYFKPYREGSTKLTPVIKPQRWDANYLLQTAKRLGLDTKKVQGLLRSAGGTYPRANKWLDRGIGTIITGTPLLGLEEGITALTDSNSLLSDYRPQDVIDAEKMQEIINTQGLQPLSGYDGYYYKGIDGTKIIVDDKNNYVGHIYFDADGNIHNSQDKKSLNANYQFGLDPKNNNSSTSANKIDPKNINWDNIINSLYNPEDSGLGNINNNPFRSDTVDNQNRDAEVSNTEQSKENNKQTTNNSRATSIPNTTSNKAPELSEDTYALGGYLFDGGGNTEAAKKSRYNISNAFIDDVSKYRGNSDKLPTYEDWRAMKEDDQKYKDFTNYFYDNWGKWEDYNNAINYLKALNYGYINDGGTLVDNRADVWKKKRTDGAYGPHHLTPGLIEETATPPTNNTTTTTPPGEPPRTVYINNTSEKTPVKRTPLPYVNESLRYAPIGLNVASLLYNNRPINYTSADAYEQYAREIGNPVDMPISTIGSYRRRNPFDEEYITNIINQNNAANARAGYNISGGNRAMQMGAQSARDLANQQALAQNNYTAYLANRKDDEDVATFNRYTDMHNKSAINARNQALASLNSSRDIASKDALIKAALYRQSLRDQRDAAIANDLSLLSENLSGLGKEAWMENYIRKLINWGVMEPTADMLEEMKNTNGNTKSTKTTTKKSTATTTSSKKNSKRKIQSAMDYIMTPEAQEKARNYKSKEREREENKRLNMVLKTLRGEPLI